MKIGAKDYTVAMNNSPNIISVINQFPIKAIDGNMVFVGDIAHVHDGFQVQTNSVSIDGQPGSLMLVRKTGGISTLSVIDGIKEVLPEIQRLMPAGVTLKPIFDQSIFVKAALNSVLMGGAMAAGLTGLMILLFLGNWRLTVIILVSIPLSVVTALLVMYFFKQTLNTMTLGGFALATGILVDDATVVIENIERHVGLGKSIESAIIDGVQEILLPTFLSTLSICIVFVPVFLLQGTAKYLFSPFSLSVVLSLLASLVLSRTLVPVMFMYLMRSSVEQHHGAAAAAPGNRLGRSLYAIHLRFEAGFNAFREYYRSGLAWVCAKPSPTVAFFVLLMGVSVLLFPVLGMDFFPQVDAGQMRLHVRAPAGTRLEETQQYFNRVEAEIRQMVGSDQVDVVLDNIGLPYSGINIALSDSATVGPMDGEILVSLKESTFSDRGPRRHSASRTAGSDSPDWSFSSSRPTSSIRC